MPREVDAMPGFHYRRQIIREMRFNFKRSVKKPRRIDRGMQVDNRLARRNHNHATGPHQ